jgi:hypothetical protein
MLSTEDITHQLATFAGQIERLSADDHGDVAMILFTLAESLSTKEGRERVTTLMLELSDHMTTT